MLPLTIILLAVATLMLTPLLSQLVTALRKGGNDRGFQSLPPQTGEG